jgi:recombination protein RecR
MSSTPRPIHDAAAAFDSLPGIGPRAALRYAYWLAAQPKDLIRKFARTLEQLADGVRKCSICGLWSDAEVCSICSDPRRDTRTICVVGTSQDARVIEESGTFKGRYHVLGGLLDPIEGRTPETLNIPSLARRIYAQPDVKEIILALDPDVSGDTTALYLMKQLAQLPVTVSRLARGLQNGAQIEYADGATISDALQNRKKM